MESQGQLVWAVLGEGGNPLGLVPLVLEAFRRFLGFLDDAAVFLDGIAAEVPAARFHGFAVWVLDGHAVDGTRQVIVVGLDL